MPHGHAVGGPENQGDASSFLENPETKIIQTIDTEGLNALVLNYLNTKVSNELFLASLFPALKIIQFLRIASVVPNGENSYPISIVSVKHTMVWAELVDVYIGETLCPP